MAVFHTTMFSESLGRLTEMTAIVPVEACKGIPEHQRAKDDAPMKTVMLLHGFSGTHSDWLFGSDIQQLAMTYHIAVLCPSGENSFYVDDRHRDALYERYLCEVLEFSRRVFPLSRRREDTTIGGFSMGGYGALLNAFKHPELFGGIIALSSAAISDRLAAMPRYEDNNLATAAYYEHVFGRPQDLPGSDRDLRHAAKTLAESGQPLPRLFMACGTEDALLADNDRLSAYLDSIGLAHTYLKGPGGHNWPFWNQYIAIALEQFFRDNL